MDEQEFDRWNYVKKGLNLKANLPPVKEGEVWWCAVGKNLGVEINGKNADFSRPVVVIKKLSRHSFIAVPLTSKRHTGTWYAEFEFSGKKEYANLTQIKAISAYRLYNRIGTLPNSDLEIIKDALKALIFGK
ncbi:type II toxin-antitoxin system PemK/MazF family toxin [Candidatus Saccharibacteria bacterium]|nr:type II toxin-antitoxin system PemK/MazF family toxin [Candidatus Saccharibacteria bacterium]